MLKNDAQTQKINSLMLKNDSPKRRDVMSTPKNNSQISKYNSQDRNAIPELQRMVS